MSDSNRTGSLFRVFNDMRREVFVRFVEASHEVTSLPLHKTTGFSPGAFINKTDHRNIAIHL